MIPLVALQAIDRKPPTRRGLSDPRLFFVRAAVIHPSCATVGPPVKDSRICAARNRRRRPHGADEAARFRAGGCLRPRGRRARRRCSAASRGLSEPRGGPAAHHAWHPVRRRLHRRRRSCGHAPTGRRACGSRSRPPRVFATSSAPPPSMRCRRAISPRRRCSKGCRPDRTSSIACASRILRRR